MNNQLKPLVLNTLNFENRVSSLEKAYKTELSGSFVAALETGKTSEQGNPAIENRLITPTMLSIDPHNERVDFKFEIAPGSSVSDKSHSFLCEATFKDDSFVDLLAERNLEVNLKIDSPTSKEAKGIDLQERSKLDLSQKARKLTLLATTLGKDSLLPEFYEEAVLSAEYEMTNLLASFFNGDNQVGLMVLSDALIQALAGLGGDLSDKQRSVAQRVLNKIEVRRLTTPSIATSYKIIPRR